LSTDRFEGLARDLVKLKERIAIVSHNLVMTLLSFTQVVDEGLGGGEIRQQSLIPIEKTNVRLVEAREW